MSGLALKVDYRVLLRPSRCVLSLAAVATTSKNVVQPGKTRVGRRPPRQHYECLDQPPRGPLFVAGARNVLSNLRCIGYSKDACRQFDWPIGQLAVVDEEADHPGRPYHAIRYVSGQFRAEEFQVQGTVRDPQPALQTTDWMVSGTPVLWDEGDCDLFDRMITDAADPAHVWKLPRGNHPDASPSTRADWERVHRAFVDTLASDRDQAAARIRDAAGGLPRENEYLHSVWGVGDADELIMIIAHGSLEELGVIAKAEGANRAICVENGGSIAAYYVPTIDQSEWLPLVRAPNLRPPGTAFAFFQLADSRFSRLEL